MERVLAVDPTQTGFAFAVVEDGERLIGCGNCITPPHAARSLPATFARLVNRFRPTHLVVESPHGSPRGRRAHVANRELSRLAVEAGLAVTFVKSEAVHAFFGGRQTTKYEIAASVCGVFPELRVRMPRRRMPWDAEDPRMNVFDATALALTAIATQ